MTGPADESGAAGTPVLERSNDEVSPLELFFDLVFVFAVSQLSHHLAENLSWPGAAETAVLLVAVFSIWQVTSFGVSFPQGGRAETVSIFVVMFVALFMNAFLPRAFEDAPWLFLGPFLAARVGLVVFAIVTASTDWLRRHYRAMAVWIVVEATFWVIGALVDPEARLAFWASAALLNVGGSWAGHPLPGRRFDSGEISFEPGRMIERSRLLLLIALGETVLAIGTAVGEGPRDVASVVAAGAALGVTFVLWSLYFRGSDPVVRESAASDADRLRVARIAVDSQLIVLAGLISLAVGFELAVPEPTGPTRPGLALTLHAGGILYLAAQSWYLHALGGRWSRARLVGIVALAAAVPVSLRVVPLAAILIVAVLLVIVTVATRRSTTTMPSAPPSAPSTQEKGTP